MSPEVKFCGITRVADAEAALRCGASFIGCVFAGGPRRLDSARAKEIARSVWGGCRTVGVFGESLRADIALEAERAGIHVIQLHADHTVDDIEWLRERTGLEVWSVLRFRGALTNGARRRASVADAMVVDSFLPNQLGGSGVPVDWRSLRAELAAGGWAGRLVLAGGLRPDNVASALSIVAPDVVDVSSGVEIRPGEKSEELMAAFIQAVRGEQPA